MIERVARRNPYAATEAALRDALKRVERNAEAIWKADAYEALVWCDHRFQEFTSDEVWERLNALGIRKPHTRAALGPIFLKAKREGLIEKTGRYRPLSKFSQRHRSLLIWRSL